MPRVQQSTSPSASGQRRNCKKRNNGSGFSLNNLQDIILLINSEKEIIYENPAVYKILGLKREERIGKKRTGKSSS